MYRIAVVDDVPTQCDALANAIDSICAARNDGYDVEISRFNTIADFEQALLSLREQDDTFDIVFFKLFDTSKLSFKSCKLRVTS